MKKLKNITHYICEKCSDPNKLGTTKLNKILWLIDCISYEKTGKSVTKATYIKRQYGPVPKEILEVKNELQKEGKIAIRKDFVCGRIVQEKLISLKEPDINGFTSKEISLSDSIIADICFNHTAKSISELTHDEIWEAAEIGEQLPLFVVFARNNGEINENDISWAKEKLKSLYNITIN